jgi:chromate transporter
MNLFLLYAEFFKIGLFSVGGGLATLPFLYSMASRYDFLKPEDIGNFLAIAQSSPGAIGVNVSAQTGYLAGGFYGAIIAPLGLISPAIITILIVSRLLAAFKENTTVNAVFSGLRPAAAGLVFAAGFGVIALSLFSMNIFEQSGIWYEAIRWKEVILFSVLFILIWKFKKHPLLYVAAAGIAGVVLGL